ncbi:hypothetical protein [Prochlorococcus sp. MIT 1341]|uniref:hypothetical protein n=1 Tax=Prochlorococcus sp. MIT 1341 TaxID=3096221 RepID=UPI002A76430F|nr:hypothetical protein [Prochlorococcus sp. MIT 1341]
MKKATAATVAEAKSNGPSLPRELSIEIVIWQLRIARAKAHPDHYLPWCQFSIQSGGGRPLWVYGVKTFST